MALPTWAETSFAMASDLAVAIFSWNDILEKRSERLYKSRMSLFYQFLMKIRILEYRTRKTSKEYWYVNKF